MVVLLFVLQLVLALQIANVLEVERVVAFLAVESLLNTLTEHVDVRFVDLLTLLNQGTCVVDLDATQLLTILLPMLIENVQ